MEVDVAQLRFDDGSLCPPALVEGVRLFNARAFFACHEVLEDAWRPERGPLREVYQGLIKTAVAFHHAENANYTGAVKVLRGGLAQLRPFHNWPGLNLSELLPQLTCWLETFERCRRDGARCGLNALPRLRLPQCPEP